MSESKREAERQLFIRAIEELRKGRVPAEPVIISSGNRIKRIHERVLQAIHDTITQKSGFTVQVVIGDFGSGKTHLMEWVMEDLWFRFGKNKERILVSRVDIDVADNFAELTLQIVERLSDHPRNKFPAIFQKAVNHLSTGRTLSIWERLKDAISEKDYTFSIIEKKLVEMGFNKNQANEIIKTIMSDSDVTPLVEKLSKEMGVKLLEPLQNLLYSSGYMGMCIFIDEFESLKVKADSQVSDILENLRVLHEQRIAKTPSTFMLVLTREDFWQIVEDRFTPLFQRWNITEPHRLGELRQKAVTELFGKLLDLYREAGYQLKTASGKETEQTSKDIRGLIVKAGDPVTPREVISKSIRRIEKGGWLLK